MHTDHPTAQDLYKTFLNDYISPDLRKRGFKGSTGTYKLPNNDYFIQIGFQKNKWNSQEVVEFTVNLSVINKRVWEQARTKGGAWMGETPSAIAMYPIKMWQSRLGIQHFFSPGDHWWKVEKGSDLQSIADDIMKRFDNEGMAAIKKQIK